MFGGGLSSYCKRGQRAAHDEAASCLVVLDVGWVDIGGILQAWMGIKQVRLVRTTVSILQKSSKSHVVFPLQQRVLLRCPSQFGFLTEVRACSEKVHVTSAT